MIQDIFRYFVLYPELLGFDNLKKALSFPLCKRTSYPVTVNMLITRRCNFRCKMCSFFGTEDKHDRELDLKDIKSFIRKLSVEKPIVFLGGGEPFVREDIYDVIAEIKNNGLKCIVSTNGYALNFQKLRNVDIDCLIVSLYGPGAIHNQITAVPDAYSVVMNNLEKLIHFANIKRLLVSITLMPENILYLEALIDELLSMGVEVVKLENLNYMTLDEYQNKDYLSSGFDFTPFTLIRNKDYTENEISALWDITKRLISKHKNRVFLKPNLRKGDFYSWYCGLPSKRRCHFIKHSLFISCEGEILPCQFLRNSKLGNIKEDDIKYLWGSDKYEALRRLVKDCNLDVCKRCCK